MIRKIFRFPFIALIRVYQYGISPLMPMACRYHPTCSHYAITAITRHGLIKGGWLSLKRILSCHPWGGSGIDLVPDVIPSTKVRKETIHVA